MKKLVLVPVLSNTKFISVIKELWDRDYAVAPLDMRLPDRYQKQIVEAIAPDYVYLDDGQLGKFRSSKPPVTPLEKGDALVIATSGTSGEPKAVIHTHKSIRASGEATSAALGVTSNDHWLLCLPVAHIGGLSVVTRALIMDIPLTVFDRFDADLVNRAGKAGASLISLVNRAFSQIDPTVFRKILLGGGRSSLNLPGNVTQTYGLTETGSGVVYDGKPLAGVDIKVIDQEVYLKGPMLFRGYRNIAAPFNESGWFATGDLGSYEKGSLTIFGRRGEAIRTGGEDVWPEKLEDVLKSFQGLDDLAVTSRLHHEWGESVVVLAVSENKNLSCSELNKHIESELPEWYKVKEIKMVKKIPRSPTGKILRSEIKKIV